MSDYNGNASIPIPFAIGETVWLADNTPYIVTVTCPECAGTKAITLIKGNGEQLSLDCQICEDRANGYYNPTGYVRETVHDFKPKKFTCRSVNVRGSEISYSEDEPGAVCRGSVNASKLYRDYDKCLVHCQELKAERRTADERMLLANISSKRKSLAYSATYWSREVKKLERELEAARARLSVCKEQRNSAQEEVAQ